MHDANCLSPFLDSSQLILPPRRVTVSDNAKENVVISIPGGYQGPYDPDLVPYMRKPSNSITDNRFKSVIFCGPAQAGKTQSLVNNEIAFTITADPHDLLIIQPTITIARDYSKRTVDRLIKFSPEVKKLMRDDSGDCVFDKTSKSGTILQLGWPSDTILAGRSIRTVVITDYDRMIREGHDSIYDLARNRTKTFLSRGKVIIESSPSCGVDEAKFVLTHPHEAPPTKGILGLYNTGTQNRLYIPCPNCGEFSMQVIDYSCFVWDDREGMSNADKAGTVNLICPANGCLISEEQKKNCIRDAKWVPKGETINAKGEVSQLLAPGGADSYWMGGTLAAFQSWSDTLSNYFEAQDDYNRTRDEGRLSVCTNTDMAAVYIYVHQESAISATVYQKRKDENLECGVVPDWASIVINSIDVQQNSFVVQAHAIGEYWEMAIIDRFELLFSNRTDARGVSLRINPPSYSEDWTLLRDEVLDRVYYSEAGEEMRALLTVCDSGGAGNTTQNAYGFYRTIRKEGRQKDLMLVKGGVNDSKKLIRLLPPKPGVRGDVPLYMIASNSMKDAVFGDLQRSERGPGYIHMGEWLPDSWFDELVAEKRVNGKWVKKSKTQANETTDLLQYCKAGLLKLGYDAIDFKNPPLWFVRDRQGPNLARKASATTPIRFRTTRPDG